MKRARTDWIWTNLPCAPRNAFVQFRREFHVSDPGEAVLNITADSRYWVYLNGEYLGHGPARGWPEHWQYDRYEIGPLLRRGDNVIAVLVNHLGEGTFQYVPAAPGLWVQAETTGRKALDGVFLSTDARWRCRIAPCLVSRVPRTGVQEGFEEQFDARREDLWREPSCADGIWHAAVEVKAPHQAPELKAIPDLTRELCFPARVVRCEQIEPATNVWTLNVKPCFAPFDISSDLCFLKAFLATQVWTQEPQKIRLLRPSGHNAAFLANRSVVPAIQPGRELEWQEVTLRKGWNTMLFPFPRNDMSADGVNPAGSVHLPQFTLAVSASKPLRWHCRGLQGSSPWAFLGPFSMSPEEEAARARHMDYPRHILPESIPADATAELYDILSAEGIIPGSAPESIFREFEKEDIMSNDVACAAFADRACASHPVANPEALLSDNSVWATLTPPPPGRNVRVLLDFGREVVGSHVFEVDAAGGTVLDFHNFEFIQSDGRENYATGMNNSFRYVCREGRQSYRTLQRRGFRYSWLIVRNQTKPLRIRRLAMEFSVYPQARQGSFACSDELLNRIWEVGAHTLKCCSEDTYTDCPSYEQVHWVGDARNEALIDWVVNGDPRLWRHCLIQAGRSLERSPLVLSHVPSAWTNILPLWSFLWMRSCREYLLWTGDYTGAGEIFSWVKRNVEGIERHRNARGLFEIQAWNLFDWADMDTPSQGIITHNNCFAALALNECAQLAEWLRDRPAARDFRRIAKELKEAVNRHLWSPGEQAYVDSIHADGEISSVFSQQTQTAALVANVASGVREERCRQIIHNPPVSFVRAGSPFFEFFLLEVLMQEGRSGEFLDVIRKDWGFMISEGATTFWEMWSAKGGRLTRSHCHGWSAAPTFFLSTYILGVEPASPGFRTVRVRPTPGDLEFVRGAMPTPQGPIEVRCIRKDGGIIRDIRLPPGVKLVK